MKVNLFKPREYEFKFPQKSPDLDSGFEPIVEADKITIKLKRVDLSSKRKIEDAMISVSGDKFDSASSIKEVSMGYAIGTIKSLQLQQSVIGWEGVEDVEGNPVKFRWDIFEELLMCNADLDPKVYGMFETELLGMIERENSFADTTKVTGKN